MGNSAAYIAVGTIIGVPLGLYVVFLGLGATSFFQRHFLYAHKFNSLLWHDVNKPEHWGFAKNQVTPFSLQTCDGQTLYAWHILPLPLYARHEENLAAQSTGLSADITKTENFKLLRHDPEARLVIYCKNLHGNAGHIAQAIRPPTFHALTDTSNYHVLAIDYRGFGRSTGSPTEKGLILDAATTINWAMDVAGIPASRIVLLGHSLGTAVASATAELFAKDGVDFAGVVLVASFSSLPTMLSGYAIAGYVPVLAPFRLSPWLLRQVMKCIVDKWESAVRLRSLTRVVKTRGGRLRLSLVHAKNDWDIPFHEDDKMFAGAVGGLIEGLDGERLAVDKAARTVQRGKDAFVTTWTEGDIVIRQELFAHGGHNDVCYYSPMLLAVMRSFGLDDPKPA